MEYDIWPYAVHGLLALYLCIFLLAVCHACYIRMRDEARTSRQIDKSTRCVARGSSASSTTISPISTKRNGERLR
ncbi:unnamed protein product, partial [Mesorhabditis belari]|uniref:Uncharacterized protein n=1 Tax=Mesorhabditis belari TaxID=2138241 RepID=A0AAF3FP09_9BILA